MFGSHRPISSLAASFEKLYRGYQQVVAGFSADEQDQMFRRVAADWFSLENAKAPLQI